MIINLKAAMMMYHPTLNHGHCLVCDLREQDPDFNKGHGEKFYVAFERAIARGDFREYVKGWGT